MDTKCPLATGSQRDLVAPSDWLPSGVGSPFGQATAPAAGEWGEGQHHLCSSSPAVIGLEPGSAPSPSPPRPLPTSRCVPRGLRVLL